MPPSSSFRHHPPLLPLGATELRPHAGDKEVLRHVLHRQEYILSLRSHAGQFGSQQTRLLPSGRAGGGFQVQSRRSFGFSPAAAPRSPADTALRSSPVPCWERPAPGVGPRDGLRAPQAGFLKLVGRVGKRNRDQHHGPFSRLPPGPRARSP